ncbi:antibiotic biosynthesis monooxygenase [Roseospira goensis]|uniref:Heme-degrading monooxygenase HmoA n=1 Tax=Roseospira goensis TaxID=391922 RepID=A0A7W6RZX3_9PROT|nr:antibiotic biosynthesis monooxygenase [Roseospira goensis]MBB4285699.1 heme-degrading monooxygenase HmoA [Roseospira goensis]
MLHTFMFYDRAPDDLPGWPILRRISGRGGRLALPLSPADADAFDRRGYGGGRFGYVTLDAGIDGSAPLPGPKGVRPTLVLRTRRAMRTQGRTWTAPQAPAAGVVMLILSELAAPDADAFLAQFTTASAFMAEQPGFCLTRLYRAESAEEEAGATFVNVAAWTGLRPFVRAFSSEAFKRILVGGFEARSRIMVARVPAVEDREAA